MNYSTLIFISAFVFLMTNCSQGKLEEKGFQVAQSSESNENKVSENGFNSDSLSFEIRPSNVLLTGVSNVRITTIYKVNYNKNSKTTFIGSNNYHYRYDDLEREIGNNWNNNYMPGFKAVYGYNMVNVSHYNIKENKKKDFFENQVLIRTLYYPAFSKDTLNNKPINRTYFMVSVYNEDTNRDGFINLRDLRRLYLFDINGERQKALVPENYSIIKSEYDPDNDFMNVFAQLDRNGNGQQDEGEAIHIFWIDLKEPNNIGQMY